MCPAMVWSHKGCITKGSTVLYWVDGGCTNNNKKKSKQELYSIKTLGGLYLETFPFAIDHRIYEMVGGRKYMHTWSYVFIYLVGQLG